MTPTHDWVQAADSDEEFERRLTAYRAAKQAEFARLVERARAAETDRDEG